jgi:SnoaL-like domain
MLTPTQVAHDYIALWNETHPTRRLVMLAGVWSKEATYVDPVMRGKGHVEINALVGAVHDKFPGHRFTLHGVPDGHGSYVRFSWTLVPEGGEAIAHGTDIVRLDDDGRIAEVVGFLDKGAA